MSNRVKNAVGCLSEVRGRSLDVEQLNIITF